MVHGGRNVAGSAGASATHGRRTRTNRSARLFATRPGRALGARRPLCETRRRGRCPVEGRASSWTVPTRKSPSARSSSATSPSARSSSARSPSAASPTVTRACARSPCGTGRWRRVHGTTLGNVLVQRPVQGPCARSLCKVFVPRSPADANHGLDERSGRLASREASFRRRGPLGTTRAFRAGR